MVSNSVLGRPVNRSLPAAAVGSLGGDRGTVVEQLECGPPVRVRPAAIERAGMDDTLSSTALGSAIERRRPSRARRSRLSRLLRRRSTVAFLMCLPLIVIVVGLIIYPAFYSIYLATLNKAQTKFVGLGNFEYLFGRNLFWQVVLQTAIFAVTAVIFKALIGLITAHLVHNLPSKGQRKWRGMLLVPWVIPLSLSTLGWWWLFDPTHSALNWALQGIGLSHVPWLSEPAWGWHAPAAWASTPAATCSSASRPATGPPPRSSSTNARR